MFYLSPFKTRYSLYAITVAVALAVCGEAAADLRSDVDAQAKPFVDHQRVAALSIGVVRGDASYIGSYGRRALDGDAPTTADTIYEIGSVSKVFTALLLADMVERGEVKLDDPVSTLLPDNFVVPQRGERKISLLDLATHHSGLPRLPPEFEPANLQNPYADLTREKLREGLAAVELPRAPGEKFEYSNLGAGLLGLALARRTGLSYEAAIQKRLCEPLGLNDTSIKIADKDQPRFARPYDPDLKLVSQWALPTLAGAGALRSTAIDLMKLVRANIDRDKGPLHEAITRSHIVHGKLEGIPGTIALAWHVALDKTTYWHSGQTGGHHCFVAFNRPLKIGTVILASGDTLRIDGLGFNLIRLLAGVTVEPMTFPKIIKVDPAKFDRYAGRYQLAPTFFLKVRRDKDRLLVRATDQEEFQVYPIAETEFVYKVVEAKITFVVDDDGTVNKLILHQNGRNMPGRRVEANDAAKQAN